MASYFVKRQSKVFGPVTGQNIVDLAKSGKIQPTDEIATDKNGPWQPATSIRPLQAAFGESSVNPQPITELGHNTNAVFRPPSLGSGQQLPSAGLGPGTRSVNIFRVFFNFWWLMIFYGMPITCRIPLAPGNSAENTIDLIGGFFLSRGFSKRTFGAKLVSGTVLKCPGAFCGVRDVRIKQSGNSVHVIGYRKDVFHILVEAGLLSH